MGIILRRAISISVIWDGVLELRLYSLERARATRPIISYLLEYGKVLTQVCAQSCITVLIAVWHFLFGHQIGLLTLLEHKVGINTVILALTS